MFARLYDLLMIPNDRFGLRHQRARLCSDATGKVLEIAIGTGLDIPHYRSAETIVGIDNHRGMLHRAIRRTWESKIPVLLVASDAHELPFADGTFDTVVVASLLCTIKDPAAALDEFSRVTAPGGKLHFPRARPLHRAAHRPLPGSICRCLGKGFGRMQSQPGHRDDSPKISLVG